MAEQPKRTPRNTKSKTPQPITDYGRIQPQAPELEEAVLGALMIEKDAYSLVSEILRPESFYEHRHQLIYAAITDLAVNQQPVDILTVKEQLAKRGDLKEVGGPFYITQLSSKVASSAHIEYHARIIAQKYLARELITFTSGIQSKAFDETLDVDDLMQEAEGKLFEISQRNMKKDYTQINPVISEAYQLIQKAAARADGLSGLESGYTKLDKMTSGWQNSDLIIIAARPAMGKTAFALNVALNAALAGIAVVIFSLEMSNVSLSDRLIISAGDLNAGDYRNARLTNEGEKQMCSAVDQLSALPITIDDTSGLTIGQIKSRAKNLQRKGKCSLVVIDYLQLVNMTAGNKSYTREQEVTQCTKEAKQLAKSLNIPVMLLSQLSRKCEERSDKTPILSDLRESGSIEQDADVVLMIHRPEYYDKNEEKGVGVIRIAKQRDGRSGDIKFRYNESLTRFADYDTEIPF